MIMKYTPTLAETKCKWYVEKKLVENWDGTMMILGRNGQNDHSSLEVLGSITVLYVLKSSNLNVNQLSHC